MKYVALSAKAIYAAVIALLGSVVTVLVDNASIGDLTDGQWAVAVLAALLAFGGVFGIRNAQP